MPRSRLPCQPPLVVGIARWAWALALFAGVLNLGLGCYAFGVRHEGWHPDTVLQVVAGLMFLAIAPLSYRISRRVR